MESISIQTLVKNVPSQEPAAKTAEKQDSDNSFSKVINKELSKSQDKTTDAKAAEENSQSNGVKLSGDDLNAAVKTDKSETSKEINEQLMQLLQMLTSTGTTVSSQDIDKLKKMISDKLKDNVLDLKLVNLDDLSADKYINTEKLASHIANKLVNDTDFRTTIINDLSKSPAPNSADNDTAFKEAVIKELSSLVKHEAKLKNTGSKEVNNFEVVNNLKPAEEVQAFEKANLKAGAASNEANGEKQLQQNSKSDSREDRLLKDLLSNSDTKSTKEQITDKIANVVTRFEAIRPDKPAAVEAPVTINKSSFNMDFIKTVKFMDTNNLKELSVKIIPKELGEIVIRLSMDNGVMKANITAANKETYNLLNSQLPAISNQLAEQNMNIQSFNLSLYNGDNFLFNGDGSGQREGRQQGRKGEQIAGINGEDNTMQNYETDESNINALA